MATRELTILEYDDDGTPFVPRHSCFPKSLGDKLVSLPTEVFDMTEADLEASVRPSYSDNIVKKHFLKAFHEASKNGTIISMKAMCYGVMLLQTFSTKLKNPLYGAWLIAPISSYNAVMETYLKVARDRYSELLTMSIKKVGRDGEETDQIDPKKAALLLSVIKNVEDRALGSSLQRQVSVSTKEPATKDGEIAKLNADAVDKRLKELELQLGEKPYNSDDLIEAEVVDATQVQQIIDGNERARSEDEG